MLYSEAAIIFNPNSTGNAPANARRLQADLAAALPKLKVSLLPTEYAGHAEILAYDFAKRGATSAAKTGTTSSKTSAKTTINHNGSTEAREAASPLIISASGDGGYNEVVNGALRAQDEGCRPVCAVLPSGNANDHARTMQSKPLLELITEGCLTQLDVLRVEAVPPGKAPQVRYAHSYAGVGLTPKVAIELNRHKLNSLQEAWILVRSLWQLKPVRISLDGEHLAIDSLTCSIIPEMAKVLTIAPKVEPTDGRFEVATLRHRAKPVLVLRLLKGAVTHLGVSRRATQLSFTLLQPSPIQLDGEIMELATETVVTVSIQKGALRTLA